MSKNSILPFVIGATISVCVMFSVEAFTKKPTTPPAKLVVMADQPTWDKWLTIVQIAANNVGRNIPSNDALAITDSTRAVVGAMMEQLRKQLPKQEPVKEDAKKDSTK